MMPMVREGSLDKLLFSCQQGLGTFNIESETFELLYGTNAVATHVLSDTKVVRGKKIKTMTLYFPMHKIQYLHLAPVKRTLMVALFLFVAVSSGNPVQNGSFENGTVIVITETVAEVSSSYSSWALDHGVGAADADDDLDGVDNLLEYALGGNPQARIDGEVVPDLVVAGTAIEYTYRERRGDTNLIYQVIGCTNLVDRIWNPVEESGRTTVPGDLYDDITLTLPLTEDFSFFRMRVELPTNGTPPNADMTSWDSYSLKILPYTRTGSPQDIMLTGCQIGTSEFLILSSSHGNPGDVTEKEARTIGGGWVQAAYGGNDDKAVEIWFRQVTAENQNTPGQIDSNNAKAYLTVVTYDGLLNVGHVTEDKFLTNHAIAINNTGAGPFLVVAVSDNSGSSSATDEFYGTHDDKTFIYLTVDAAFEDSTADRIRGAIASIQLVQE